MSKVPKLKKKTIFLVFLVLILFSLSLYGGSYLYRLKNPKTIKSFQDPFLFNNGTRVQTVEEWDARRIEIKELLLSIEYGHMPGRPDGLKVTQISENQIENYGSFRAYNFTIIPFNATPQLSINFTVFLYIPLGSGPFPVIIEVGLHGNSSKPPFNGTMLQKGYMYAAYAHKELDPDTEGYDIAGPVQAAYPTYDWGSKYKAWFHENFGLYAGKEKDLPFDQHFLRALIAPRLILSNDGLGDLWANPMGTHAVHLAAQPVFDFLNASKNNAIYFREGGHAFLEQDFNRILDFSELMLDQIKSDTNFYNSPFDFQVSIPYSAPK